MPDIDWLYPAKVVEHEGIFVVRDDLLHGGTKRRVAHLVLNGKEEYVYASTVHGYAQLALAIVCQEYAKKLTLFVAKRPAKGLHELTREAQSLGARIVEVWPQPRLSYVRAEARRYVAEERSTRHEVPFGLATPEVLAALADVAREAQRASGLEPPTEVWTAAGSGTLSRALQLAWPDADFHAVAVEASDPDVGRAELHRAEGNFSRPAKILPPFPTVKNYDGYCWEWIKNLARPGAWFWNVAGD
jgi:hypothetical protein